GDDWGVTSDRSFPRSAVDRRVHARNCGHAGRAATTGRVSHPLAPARSLHQAERQRGDRGADQRGHAWIPARLVEYRRHVLRTVAGLHRFGHTVRESLRAAKRRVADRLLRVVHESAWAQSIVNGVDGVTELDTRPLDLGSHRGGAYLA